MAQSKGVQKGGSGNLDQSPLHLLHRAGQCAGDVFQSEMSTGELTPRQYAVLVTVARHEGLSQTNLVSRTGIDRSTLADIIRRMMKKGLIQRRRTKEDARAYSVKLTDEGRRILESAQPTVQRVDERVLAVLPGQQRDQFLKDLALIVGALSEAEKEQADQLAAPAGSKRGASSPSRRRASK
ncbi:MAG: MarR family transcriptional regulator [Pseudomonadota bacterium]